MPPVSRGVKILMIATAVLSIGVAGLEKWSGGDLGAWLGQNTVFIPQLLWHGKIWTAGTYTLLNPTVFGLLIAELMLWMFAGPLERRWGMRRFLLFYFATTAAAAGATALVGLVAPDVARYPYHGIGTALEALAAAFAMSFPDDQIYFSFVLPIRARYLIHISVGFTLLSVVMEGSVVPFIAPLFGLVAGIVFSRGALKGPQHLLLRLRVWWIERRMAGRKLRVVPGREEPRSKSGSDGYLH